MVADFSFESDLPSKADDGTTVEFLSALDDAGLRLQCFQLCRTDSRLNTKDGFEEVLTCAMYLYDWVMGKDDTTIEEAAEPASVKGSEECEPRH